MRHGSDAYFVKVAPGSAPVVPDAHKPVQGRSGLGQPGHRRHRRRRRRVSGRSVMLVVLAVALGVWFLWASQRPGGVSGTINGWISHVRGDVAQVSSDPDLRTARNYFTDQYKQTGVYPNMSEADLGGVGIGVGVTVLWCSPQAVVIQGQSGAGTSSRLLLAGKDLGALPERDGCPLSLADPSPWKLK